MNTNLKLALVGLAALAVAAPALGNTYGPTTQSGLAPGSVDVSGVAGLGAAFCQNVNPTAPLACAGTGLGVFFDVTGLTGGSYATGSCKVDNTAALVKNDFAFTCGTDRDNDTFVTNVDNSPTDSPGSMSTDSDGWDDDFATGYSGGATSVSVNVCFRSDVAYTAASQGVLEDSTAPASGSGYWDDVVFFVGQNGVSLPTVGSVAATLTLTTGSSCGTGNVSGHTHG